MNPNLIDSLIIKNNTKIIFLIMDGLGGIPMPGESKTELESANTPNMDELAKKSICGLLDPVGPGITPGAARPILPFSAMTLSRTISAGGSWKQLGWTTI